METKQYRPGETITLYNFKSDSSCQGILYVNPQIEALSVDEYFNFLDNFFLDKLSSLGKLAQAEGKKIITILMVISIVGLMSVFSPILISQLKFSLDSRSDGKINAAVVPTNISKLSPILDKNISDFEILIPKINLDSKVIANVDTTAENLYDPSLAQGVAHAKDSYLPGQNGPTILFAHSTDSIFDIKNFDARFFALKDLNVGDSIEIDFEGKTYKYQISNKKVISPLDVDYLRNYSTSLFLVTCWPPGTSWQRLVLSANLVH